MGRIKDLKGKKFGRWTVIEFAGSDKTGTALWECVCACGTKRIVERGNLVSGKSKSCGCLRKEVNSKTKVRDITGQKFGRLTVLKRNKKEKEKKVSWLCRCKCGVEIIVTSTHLISGHTQSCGCYKRDRIKETHSGEKNSSWKGGITPLNTAIRATAENLHWRLDVFARDGFKCQHCKDVTKRKLNAHHKKPLAKIIQENNITTLNEAQACDELWDINNGITLCEDCHKLEHKKIKLISINKN